MQGVAEGEEIEVIKVILRSWMKKGEGDELREEYGLEVHGYNRVLSWRKARSPQAIGDVMN